jgi:hypothetical protein
MISTVWLAGRLGSLLRSSDQVMAMRRSGLDIGPHGDLPPPDPVPATLFGAPDRRANEALALRVVRILLIENHALSHRSASGRCSSAAVPASPSAGHRASNRSEILVRFDGVDTVGLTPPRLDGRTNDE